MSGILAFLVIIMPGKCQEFSFFRSKSHMTSVLTNEVMLCLGGKQTSIFYIKIFKTVLIKNVLCFPPSVMLPKLDQLLSI